ncbi:MAG: hypothetical protein LBF22_14990 [Deltaproteobacteria bacterium]|jgi:hypothetical protein|nr:hypothetical protein [Deltaproteobacteria bacterium]
MRPEVVKDPYESEKAFWLKTFEVSQECLELDRGFLSNLAKRTAVGNDPLEPALWENYIEARKSLVDYTTANLNLLARDKKGLVRNKDIKDRLETTLSEVVKLEEKLTSFLAENLSLLKETIDDISKNQLVFSAYAQHNYKPRPEAIETTL